MDPVPPLRTIRPGVPAIVEQAITKALAKVPADRYPSVAEFRSALVETGVVSTAGQPRSQRARWAARGGLALGCALLLLFGLNAVGLRTRWLGLAEPVRIGSLAVLPLAALSNDSTQLGDGMTEALITDLGRIRALRVISRTGVMRYKGTTKTAQEIARELNVDGVVEGGVQRAGDQLRIDLRLISAASGYQLWAERFEEKYRNRFAVEDAIARSLVSALRLSVTSSEKERLRTPPTTIPRAYDDFLLAKIHLRRYTWPEDSLAIELLKGAVALDPGFAAAYAELAYAYGVQVFYYAPQRQDVLERGLLAAEKALRLDPDLAEAHFARGYLLWTPAGHFAHEAAIQNLRRAAELNPNLEDSHQMLGQVYWHLGLFTRSTGESVKALAINPGNTAARVGLVWAAMLQGHGDEALQLLRELPGERGRAIPTYQVASILSSLGRREEAATLTEDYLRATPQDPGGLLNSVRAMLHAGAGETAAEHDIQRSTELGVGFGHFHHAAYSIASAYALMHRRALAVRWLRRVVDDGFPCYPLLARDPNLDDLRQDPAFLALLAELKSQWEHWEKTL
jgi:TolB-like protein